MNLKNFILLGKIEGISSLLLFFVAMPLKYVFDFPLAVKYAGWAHGVLFTIYVLWLALLGIKRKWKILNMAMLFIAAILPGGPLYLENFVLKRENEI